MQANAFETLTIGQLARKAGVNLETIRFYEQKGLIPEPPRNKSGHRQYPPESVQRTDFIKRCQALGFSLKEIKNILELRISPNSTGGDMKARVSGKLSDVEKKIEELIQLRDALHRLLQKCSGTGPVSHCPILEELYR